MRGGLSGQQIVAVQHLVAAAVPVVGVTLCAVFLALVVWRMRGRGDGAGGLAPAA